MTQAQGRSRSSGVRATVLVLGALVAGLVLGIVAGAQAPDWATWSVAFIEPFGQLWLNALRMTIVPLVFSLLVVGITMSVDAAQSGRLAARAVLTFLVFLTASAALATVAIPAFVAVFPLDATSATALRTAMGATHETPTVPAFGDFIAGLAPTNVIAAAAEDAILPLLVFATVLAFAITRLPPDTGAVLRNLFRAISEAMLIIIQWIIAIAPIGVFALGYAVAVKSGTAAFGTLLHYVVTLSAVGIVVMLVGYVVAVVGGRLSLTQFARAIIPAQAVAISTQSSLASLPAMLGACRDLGVREARADVVLPLAVALFRASGPAMNLGVALYVAHLFGIEPGTGAIATAVVVATLTSLGSVSLPGSISFLTSITPIAAVLGVPIEPLVLLVAVETIPDIFRTLSNVTMDVAVAATVDRQAGAPQTQTQTQD